MLKQMLPCFTFSHATDGLGRNSKSASEIVGCIETVADKQHIDFGELSSVYSLSSVVAVLPRISFLSIVSVLLLGSHKQVPGVHALTVVTEVARNFPGLGTLSTGQQQRSDMHTNLFSIESERGVARLTVMKSLLYTLVNTLLGAPKNDTAKPLKRFALGYLTRINVSVGSFSVIVTVAKASLKLRLIAVIDTAGRFLPLLQIVRAAQTLSLVRFFTVSYRTSTFHTGSAPLGGVKGVYH